VRDLIDTHVHFWDPAVLRYDWIKGSPVLEQTYRPERLPRQGPGWQLEALVMVQGECAHAQGQAEVEWVTELSRQHPVIAGMVAFAPLELGEAARPQVEWLSRQPLVKGVRRLIQDEAAGFAVQPDFVRGVALLADYGLSFDLCLRHHQLRETLTLVRQCPAVSFVLDHIAKPDIRAGRLDPWRAELAELAGLPNVVCKLSGVVTEADHAHWQPADLRPYIDHVLSVFGPERVMFGSDWPVATLAARYEQWVQVLEEATAGLPAEAQRRLWHDNAQASYRL